MHSKDMPGVSNVLCKNSACLYMISFGYVYMMYRLNYVHVCSTHVQYQELITRAGKYRRHTNFRWMARAKTAFSEVATVKEKLRLVSRNRIKKTASL
jgi:hypothetical protein